MHCLSILHLAFLCAILVCGTFILTLHLADYLAKDNQKYDEILTAHRLREKMIQNLLERIRLSKRNAADAFKQRDSDTLCKAWAEINAYRDLVLLYKGLELPDIIGINAMRAELKTSQLDIKPGDLV